MELKVDNFIYTIVIFFTIISLKVSSQTLPIKERYDSKKSMYVYDAYSDGTNITSQGNIGDGLSYVLESFWQMYKTTRDKAYLIKFINHAIHLQEIRGEYAIENSSCEDFAVNSAYAFSSCLYHNGLIHRVMLAD